MDAQTFNDLVNLVGNVVTLGLAVTSVWSQRHGKQEVTGLLVLVLETHVVLEPEDGAEVIELPHRDIESHRVAA